MGGAINGKVLASEAFLADVTGVDLAKRLGIHRSTLSAYHNGWRIPPEGWVEFAAKYRAAVKAIAHEQGRVATEQRKRVPA